MQASWQSRRPWAPLDHTPRAAYVMWRTAAPKNDGQTPRPEPSLNTPVTVASRDVTRMEREAMVR
jgi:hypothetical protein